MHSVYVAIIFLIFSFITWLSVSFRIASCFVDDNFIFSNLKMTILFYFCNIVIAIFLTIICYSLVTMVQRKI
nr:MAG TPA: hypothetical protein [Caudoviricetes sp.]